MSETSTPAGQRPKKSVALSGVAAGSTALCTVGRSGNDLHYRGYDILDIAEVCEFEEIAHLLWFGLPDQGFMGLAEIAEHTARIRDAFELPLIVDADTGFGNALNVHHTVRTLERAGADCIQLEDQVAPKRCGHFEGKAVVSTDEAVGRIKAAVDARRDPDLLILARTDAAAVHGFEAAVERAQRFAEAGADILVVEAVRSADEVRALPQRLAKPQLMNMVIGGRTPLFQAQALGELGYGIVRYANAALQGAVAGMQRALTALRDEGEVQESSGLVAPFAERQRLVGKAHWDQLEQRYA